MRATLERTRKVIYSCFVVANLFAIIYCNLPPGIGNGIVHDLDRLQRHYQSKATRASALDNRPNYEQALARASRVTQLQKLVASVNWRIRKYAYHVGLDNRWQMFGRQSRFNWWFVISARYSNGEHSEERILELPRQAKQSGQPRTFWQYHFFDFREGKFHLNLYRDAYARAAYCRYLARQYPEYHDLPIESVAMELYYQRIKEPAAARATGSHLEAEIEHHTFNRFAASGDLEPPGEASLQPRP